MTAPNGAITSLEELRETLRRGVRVLWLAPWEKEVGPLKFSILDPNLRQDGHDRWIITKAFDLTRKSPFDGGVAAFPYKPEDWWWFENFWEAWACNLKGRQ